MNYWYVARPNEIFIDADNWKRSRAHTRARLQGAIEYGKLPILDVEIHESSTNHVHILITLAENMPPIERAVWGIILHSDIYRGCATIMRHSANIAAADVLINSRMFHRMADAVCHCKNKHKQKIMVNCKAAIALRGDDRIRGFFGKPSKGKCKWL